ncbi:hypothetical protein V6N13_018446 [Hibiscus sabdariffa]|uniref:Uncharacterized protein n=1 Tax=Hibiscus sabdariffa TaxID=183260 RepID=A0ABR2ELX1_9ROSI
MTIGLPRIISSKKVPRGYFAVYVGENKKRFVIPVSFLNQPSFQDLRGMSEQEFGYYLPLELIVRELTQISKYNFVKQTSKAM